MGQEAKTGVEIRDFAGINLLMDALDIDPGQGETQVNASSRRTGALRVRGGLALVRFEEDDS